MDGKSQVRVSPAPQGRGESIPRDLLESFDEDVVDARRASTAAPYRGVPVWLFAVGAVVFGAVMMLVASAASIVILVVKLGDAQERVVELNAQIATKAEAYSSAKMNAATCEAQLNRMDGLLKMASGK